MKNKIIIAEIVEVANALDDKSMFDEADKLTAIAARLAQAIDLPFDDTSILDEFDADSPINFDNPDLEGIEGEEDYGKTIPLDDSLFNGADEDYDLIGGEEEYPEIAALTASVRLKKKIRI